MSGRFLTVRFPKLPAAVVGPRTQWFITIDRYGKNACRAALVAKCVTNGKCVVLCDGRARETEGRPYNGFLVQIGTIHCKIVSAAVAQGVAEFVAD